MKSRVVISTRAWVYLCLCVFITVGAAGPAGAEPPDAEHRAELAAMRRQIEALRTLVDQQADQIARLSANQEESWMTERRRAEVRELVREVLADTDTRVALLDEGMAAGWDNGFFLASPDDAFLMRIKGMIQVRYTASIQDDTADPSGDDTDTGFGISRTRFGFMGHVIDPSWQYMLWTGFDCKGDAVVLDAYVRKAFDEHLSVTMGQFKLPYLYEYLVSETRLQFVERSLVAGEFCGTYTQGVMVTWQNDWMRLHGSFNDGLSAINTQYNLDSTDFALTGRAEIKLFGEWSQYLDWESRPDEEPMLVIGAAIHYQQGEHGTATPESEILRWTVDGSWELGGGNLFAAVVGSHDDEAHESDAYAVVVQGGIFVCDHAELIARYEWADGVAEGEQDLSVITVGVNWFLHGHALKISTDVGYGFNGVGPTYSSTPLGWREDEPDGDGQVVVRSQAQLQF